MKTKPEFYPYTGLGGGDESAPVNLGGGWWDPFWKTSGGGAWLGGHEGHKLPPVQGAKEGRTTI